MKELDFANDLLDFINSSPTAYHAVKNVEKQLLNDGFEKLNEEDGWTLNKDGKYYVIKNDSAIIAFNIGNIDPEINGFRIIGSHTDSPGFRIKPSPEIVTEGHYVKLNTEVYGGPILNTWMDRPLGIAGRVMLRGEDIMYPQKHLININKPLLIIPNLAIHMNRNVNTGVELNKQKDMIPLIAQVNESFQKENFLMSLVAKRLDVSTEEILDFDLFLYEYEKGCLVGMNDEFISSSRLDNLAMVHASLSALLKSSSTHSINVIACFDNEEVGSATKQGAASPFFANVLERVVLALKKDREVYLRALARSFMISADLAHGVHPNIAEKHDPVNRPMINKGPVIKISASQSYTTDSESSTVYEQICKKAEVDVQKFVNRSDERGGSTIGPISSTQLPIRSVDVGTPILAMHSIRELGGVKDHYAIMKSFRQFFDI